MLLFHRYKLNPNRRTIKHREITHEPHPSRSFWVRISGEQWPQWRQLQPLHFHWEPQRQQRWLRLDHLDHCRRHQLQIHHQRRLLWLQRRRLHHHRRRRPFLFQWSPPPLPPEKSAFWQRRGCFGAGSLAWARERSESKRMTRLHLLIEFPLP